MARVAVLDADVLIGHLDSKDAQHGRAKDLLRSLASEGVRLRASTITLAEVLVAPTGAGRASEATAALDRIEVEEVTLSPDAAGRLASLRAQTGCRLPDCCVLLAAEDADAAILGSFDVRLRNAASVLGFTLADESVADR